MLVVSDSSPLNILIRIAQVDVLPKLFTSVAVPQAVADELSNRSTPQIVRAWMASPPTWLSVRQSQNPVDLSRSQHRGEKEAIALALELHADAILLDEAKPRRDAQAQGLQVVGTIRVLERAADDGLIDDLRVVHVQIKATDFRIHPSISTHRCADISTESNEPIYIIE